MDEDLGQPQRKKTLDLVADLQSQINRLEKRVSELEDRVTPRQKSKNQKQVEAV